MTSEQEQMVIRNQKLVGYAIKKCYGDYEELLQTGMIGLVKGAVTFDPTKGFKESTYLYRCIQNELNIFFRKKKMDCLSLEAKIKNGEENLEIIDLVQDKFDIEKNLLYKEELKSIYSIINKLNSKEKIIICSLYELNNFEKKTQKELAKELNLSQAQISRVHNKVIKKIRKMLGEIE